MIINTFKAAYNKMFRKREIAEICKLAELHYDGENYMVTLEAEHPIIAMFLREVVELFRKTGGINYIETSMFDPVGVQMYSIIIQPQRGLTPAKLNRKLRDALERIAEMTGDETRIDRDIVLETIEIANVALMECGYDEKVFCD